MIVVVVEFLLGSLRLPALSTYSTPSVLFSTLHQLPHLTLIKPYDINIVLLTLQMVILKLKTEIKYHIANKF